MRKSSYNFTEKEEQVIESIEYEVGDAKDMAKAGLLQGEARGCVIRSILNIMDNCKPRLTGRERIRICDYVQDQSGICM